MSEASIIVETLGPAGVIRLNRPKAKNALSGALMRDLSAALDALDEDEAIEAIVVTGAGGVFSAGVDIKELAALTPATILATGFPGPEWDRLARAAKPTIAAVSGIAFGGGFELALQCDMILASHDARFALPEVRLGTIPGLGGTQRLPRAVGKAKAMDMCLTGREMGAEEAERSGLVARVVPEKRLEGEALALAEAIAQGSRAAQSLVRKAIQASAEKPLSEGLAIERRLFRDSFAHTDRAEGMGAFIEKRPPRFRKV